MSTDWIGLARDHLGDARAFAFTALRIGAIVVAAWIATEVLQCLIRRFRQQIAQRMDDREAVKRAEIVKDYFTGFFLLLENQIRQGDVVRLGEHGGLVEEITLRYVRLRDYDGNVHFVPNGQIAAVVNMSRGHAQAVIDVGVAYREDLDRVMQVMREVAERLREDAEYGHRILDPFELAGVERWDDSAIILRGRFRVAPLEQWAVRREYLRRLKVAFDVNGIEIPFPQLAVHGPQGFSLRQTPEAVP